MRWPLSPDAVLPVVVGAGAVALVTGLTWAILIWRRSRVTPEERERRRRAAIAATGKITSAELADIRDDTLYYCYYVAGVEYNASQDISTLHDYMPSDVGLGLTSVSVKYDPRIPANSIVLAEKWSGLHSIRIS